MSSDKVAVGMQPTIQAAVTGDEPSADDRVPAVSATLGGRYTLGRRIGKGGMGEVMAARDEQIARDVAIKRMRAANPSEKAIQRFLREANVQGRLEHPAIVPVHEIGRDSEGMPYFVMKKLSGTPLSRLLGDDSVPLHRLLRAFADVCLAVELAHVRGVVHRDLKPDNVMLGDFGETYVLDWGVAKIIGEEDGEFADVGSSASGDHATRAGAAIGTPGYMSPEQVNGVSDIDGRADVYALGCMLFDILAGQPMHPRGEKQMPVADRDRSPAARTPDRAIAPELDALCVAATEPDRDRRVKTARELAERIERFIDGDRDLVLRRSLARAHLDKAHAAFESSDSPADRAVAMREAAGALALDPSLVGAAELVGRLMLEPPREIPAEVREALVADDIRETRGVARAGLWAVLGAMLFIPLVVWIARPHTLHIALLMALFVVDGLVAIHALRSPRPRPGIVVLSNMIVVIVLARLYSPILVAPGVAATLGMAMALTPRFSFLGSPVTVAVGMAGGVLGPLLAEQLGLVARTLSVSPQGMLLTGPGFSGEAPGVTILVGALFALALVVTSVVVAAQVRARAVEAARRMHLQAWQLRQLVPR